MASSSSSAHPMKYQVFLSFRGPDTRLNFTAHLLDALRANGFKVFFDDDSLEKGEDISPALAQGIAASDLSIIILSKDYASSKPCLVELSHIMERKDAQEHKVLPIFYHVDRSDVKDVRGGFEISFEEQKSKWPAHVERWKAAFVEVGKLAGWVIKGGKDNGSEPEHINKIIDIVKQRLMGPDVFLSFGEDTNLNFTAYLRNSLKDKGYNVFVPEDIPETGEKLSPAVSQAIEVSKLSIIVFSKGYTSSKSSLAEFSYIMDRKEAKLQFVLPIFYHVSPSDVKRIDGRLQAAFVKFGKLKGWHIRGILPDKPDTEYIKEIVEEATQKLMNAVTGSSSDELVGIVQKNTILRLIEKEDIRVIGLCGMAGIGKTTLAEAVYKELSPMFKARCFIREVSNKTKEQLQHELLSKVLKDKNIPTDTLLEAKSFQQRLNNTIAVVVLDDVSDPEHINFMGVRHFGHGSKIILTCREKQTLRNGGAEKIHEVKELDDKDSLQLFLKFAGKQLNPPVEFLNLSNEFIKYAQGHPFALKLLGSRLHDEPIEVWRSEVLNLQHLEPGISKLLEKCLCGLHQREMDIFLDIVILYKGMPKEEVEAILINRYNEGAVSTISWLINKCLLEITSSPTLKGKDCQCISMHALLEEKGKEIESKDPGKRTRLWRLTDVEQVQKRNERMDSIEGIKLNMPQTDHPQLCPTTFQNMPNLRFIHWNFRQPQPQPQPQMRPTEAAADTNDIVFLPDELRYLCWQYYPFKSLSSSFDPKNLVVLKLHGGKMEQLWNEDYQGILNLRKIDLTNCMNLKKIPNLSGAINLKSLICLYCYSLDELPCLNYLASLEELNLSHCRKLRKIPDLLGSINLKSLNCTYCTSLDELPCLNHLTSLETLQLFGCKKINKFPTVPKHLSSLDLSFTGIEEVPDSIEYLIKLESLKLGYSRVKNVSNKISKLESLHDLNLNGCPITKFPEIPRSIVELLLSETQIKDCSSSNQNPVWNVGLSDLEVLMMTCCESIVSLSELPPYILFFNAFHCKSLEKVSFSVTDKNLYQLDHFDIPKDEPFYMLFTNCRALSQDSIDNIEENAMLKIGSLAKKLALEYAYNGPQKFVCCFPRNEISAKNFVNQSESCLLTLKITPNGGCGSRFLVFAICLVVNIDNYNGFGILMGRRVECICRYKLKASTGNYEMFQSEWLLGGEGVHSGNHVVILFSEDMVKKDKDYDEASFEFYLFDRDGNPTVEKCGVHVSYLDEESILVNPQH